MNGLTPEDMISQGEALQKKYATRRKRWARHIGAPYDHDIETPEPAVFPDGDDQEG